MNEAKLNVFDVRKYYNFLSKFKLFIILKKKKIYITLSDSYFFDFKVQHMTDLRTSFAVFQGMQVQIYTFTKEFMNWYIKYQIRQRDVSIIFW